MSEDTPPTADDVVRAIDNVLADRRRKHPHAYRYVTRDRIAEQLGVAADDVSAEGSPTGPLLEASEQGWIVEHPRYRHEWTLTDDGQTRSDSALFT
ncbi:MAG: hypothetical protein ACLP50_06900 [Solirubrobacteraceae bacterium]|jgi:hypothetical protein